MVKNKYRLIGGDSDYNDNFQCLNCKDIWIDNRYNRPYSFCPFCGIKLEGIIESREHYTPKWQYKISGNNGLPNYISDKIYKLGSQLRDKDNKIVWQIQSQTTWKEWEESEKWTNTFRAIPDWIIERELKGSEATAKNAYSWLDFYKKQTADHYFETKYRVIRMNSNQIEKLRCDPESNQAIYR